MMSKVKEVKRFDLLSCLGDLSLNSDKGDIQLSEERKREYHTLFEGNDIQAFRTTKKSITIYFPHYRIQFKHELLKEVVNCGKDTKNFPSLLDITEQVTVLPFFLRNRV